MSQSLRAAVVQLCSRHEVSENLARCAHWVERATQAGARLVVLPENFCFIGPLKRKVEIAEPLDAQSPGPILAAMMALARRTECDLVLGGMPIQAPPGDAERCFNTAIHLGPAGDLVASYHKIHLFDIQIPGAAEFTESSRVAPGDQVVTSPIAGTRMGLSICYDLRFPELYRRLQQAGAEICTIPAAFTMHTGKDHWFPLLRARAIENQFFVLAPGQYGRHNEERLSYGKSCIIDPWGSVLAQVGDHEGFAVADLDFDFLRKVRRELPCLEHVRLEP